MEYRNRTSQTVINTLVYESKNSVASTGRAFFAVNLCTVAEYQLNLMKTMAILMRYNGSTKGNHALT